ncbi:MAG: hypothetical protein ACR2MX_09720 [Cyclobacteriaceae bacterium]
MVRKSMFYGLLIGLLAVSTKATVTAQSDNEYRFDSRPIPEELNKVKPYNQARWSRGTIKINNQKAIQSYVCYEPEKEVLLTYTNGRVSAYSALQVEGFSLFDADLKLVRHYQSLPHDPSTNARKYYIYEVINIGEFSLLRRETSSHANCHKSDKATRQHFHFDYFVCHENTILTYKEFQNSIQSSLTAKDQPFKNLVVKNTSSEITLANRRRMIRTLNQIMTSPDKPELAMVKK